MNRWRDYECCIPRLESSTAKRALTRRPQVQIPDSRFQIPNPDSQHAIAIRSFAIRNSLRLVLIRVGLVPVVREIPLFKFLRRRFYRQWARVVSRVVYILLSVVERHEAIAFSPKSGAIAVTENEVTTTRISLRGLVADQID